MESIKIKVHPDVMEAKANELDSEKNTVSSIMEEAKSKMASLTGVWQSSSSDEYQTRFRQVHSDIEVMLATMTEYVRGLKEAAGILREGEVKTVNTTQGLPTSGIFNQ